MAIKGLPLRRQEPDSNQDILAGADFLSIFLESSLHGTTTTSKPPPTTTIFLKLDEEDYTTYRNKRSSLIPLGNSQFAQSTEKYSINDSGTDKEGVVVAVRISSSVGSSVDNAYRKKTTIQPYFLQQHPSLVAKVSKSELSVEESDPVTKDNEAASDYSSGVRVISRFDQTNSFLNNNQNQEKQFRPTVIFHDSNRDNNGAQSVSYSSIIQTIPVENDKSEPHERRERNYNDVKSPYVNSFNNAGDVKNKNDSKVYTFSVQITTPKPWFIPTTSPSVDKPKLYGQPEQNYEVDEALSLVTNGRVHGVQPSKPEAKSNDNQKFGYVVEGKTYRKYRVEERTADGFIVGEYGVVSHDDGSLRGVRYTADGTTNPQLISQALMKFLSL